jgi:hypothetical protein
MNRTPREPIGVYSGERHGRPAGGAADRKTTAEHALRTKSRLKTAGLDDGAAMVEMAFVFALLMMLLVGTTTSAIAFSQNNSIENSAREASRYAATLPEAGTTDWLRDVRDVARAAAQGNLDTSVNGQYICVSYYDGSSWTGLKDTGGTEAASGSCYSDGLPADQARIQVVTGRDTEIQVVLFSPDLSLEARAAARYER